MLAPVTDRPLTPRQQERRQRILSVTQTLVAELGYQGVSMRAIAAASGTAEKTLYNIFGTKDRLVALSAYFRTAHTFARAAQEEAFDGWPRLVSFARLVGDISLELPDLTRTLAVLLIDHAELVGLDRLYTEYVSPSLVQMVATGALVPSAPVALITRLIRLALVSGVVFWAKGEFSDKDLCPYLHLRLCETLLPFVTPAGAELVQARMQGAIDVLTG